MRIKLRKLIALFLALSLSAGSIPIDAFAQEEQHGITDYENYHEELHTAGEPDDTSDILINAFGQSDDSLSADETPGPSDGFEDSGDGIESGDSLTINEASADGEAEDPQETDQQEEEFIGMDGIFGVDAAPYDDSDIMAGSEAFRDMPALLTNGGGSNDLRRYTVLILDTSGSMSGTPAYVQKQAAIKFCTSVLDADGTNYVALIQINTNSGILCNFTSDLDTLTYHINHAAAYGGTNITEALKKADDLLFKVAQLDTCKIIKNIVLCSDGLPEHGQSSGTGPYTSSDGYFYAYANSAYSQAAVCKANGCTLYTLGFFHSLSGKNLAFGQQFMSDLASENSSHIVTDVDELEFVFGEIAKEIKVEKHTFSFESSIERTTSCRYSDGYFLNDARTYDPHLATMSLCFELTTWTRKSGLWTSDVSLAETGNTKWQNAYDLLVTKLGYRQFYVNDYWVSEPQDDSIGVIIANKTLSYDNSTVIAVGIRGGRYAKEWSGNFNMGLTGEHYGFADAKQKVLNSLTDYIQENDITGPVKLWIVGYSRGGAVANLVGGELTDGYDLGNSATVEQKDLFVYTFEAPQGAVYSKVQNGDYSNIHNIINYNDIVPLVAPSAWGFSRYNDDYVLPSVVTTSDFASRLARMEEIYKTEFDEDAPSISQYGIEFRLEAYWGGILSLGQPHLYPVPYTVPQEELLKNTTTFLFDQVMHNRLYYYMNYQTDLTQVLSSLNSDRADPFELWTYISKHLSAEHIIEILLPLSIPFLPYETKLELMIQRIEKFAEDTLKVQETAELAIYGSDFIVKLLTDMFLAVAADFSHLDFQSTQDLIACTCLFANGGAIKTHYPEVTLAWLMSQDTYYEGGETDHSHPNYRTVFINCPVDVSVTDDDTNTVVAAIVENTPVTIDGSCIQSYVNTSGEKVFDLPSDGNYSITISATGDGNLSYTVVERDVTGFADTRIVSFENTAISPGDSLYGLVPSLDAGEEKSSIENGSSVLYSLLDSNGNEVSISDELRGEAAGSAVFSVTVSANNGNGNASGSGQYHSGRYAAVTAAARPGCEFLGWFRDDVCVSECEEYRFAVKEDVTLEARFGEIDYFTLYINTVGNGTVENKTIPVPAGTRVQLAAKAGQNESFTGWLADTGEIEAPEEADTWFVMPASDATVTATFTGETGTAPYVRLDRHYLKIPHGNRAKLHATASSDDSLKLLNWETDADHLIKIDNDGTVTALADGTAYVYVSFTIDDVTYSDCCRVDVTEEGSGASVCGVALATKTVTAELLSTDYSKVNINLLFEQSISSAAGISSAEEGQNVNREIVIDSAHFSDAATAKKFRLRIEDDRTLSVVPTEEAVNKPCAVQCSYSSSIIVTIQGISFTTSDRLKLTVKKTSPNLKTSSISFNTFNTEEKQFIQISGATVESIAEEALPTWLKLEGDCFVLQNAPIRGGGIAKLRILTKEWAIPVSVSIPVNLVYKEPGIKLSASSVTFAKAGSQGVQLKLLCTQKTDTLNSLKISDLMAPAGFSILNFDPADGSFTLVPTGEFLPGTHKLTVSFQYTEKTLPLRLTVNAADPALLTSVKELTLNSVAGDNTTFRLSASLADYKITNPVFCLTDKKGTAVDHLTYTYSEGAVTVCTNSSTLPDMKYTLLISDDHCKAISIRVSTLPVNNSTITVSSSVSGIIDSVFPETNVKVKPRFRNYSGGYRVTDWSIAEYEGKNPVGTAASAFNMTEQLCFYAADLLNEKHSYYLTAALLLDNGQTATLSNVKLPVKRTAVNLILEKNCLTLNKTVEDVATVGISASVKSYILRDPVITAPDDLLVSYADGKLSVGVCEQTEYGKIYQVEIKATGFDLPVKLNVRIPARSYSTITSVLTASGKIDVVHESTSIIITPAFSNCSRKPDPNQQLEFYCSSDRYSRPVTDLFQVTETSDGGFIITKAPGSSINPRLKYRAVLKSRIRGVPVESKPVDLIIIAGSAGF